MIPFKVSSAFLQTRASFIHRTFHLQFPKWKPNFASTALQQFHHLKTNTNFNYTHPHLDSIPLRQFAKWAKSSEPPRKFSYGRLGLALLAGGFICGMTYQAWIGKCECEEPKPMAENATAAAAAPATKCRPDQIDYKKIYDAIEQILYDADYDDTSYGPVFVRLAWHASGSYDKMTNTGGSSKATMRFDPEAKYAANLGLGIAREKLEIVKKQFPMISYGDLWTLAAVCAIQEMGGPIIPWRPGRKDGTAEDCPPDGRLPDGSNGNPSHPRDIFYRMGFNDQEITCLIGCHCLGRCHKERSGFQGPWTFSPTSFSNQFFAQLLENEWIPKKDWSGNPQFEDKNTAELMMTPVDMSFRCDPEFRKWVEIYATDEGRFYCDFISAFVKLIELGVEFPPDTPRCKFKRILT